MGESEKIEEFLVKMDQNNHVRPRGVGNCRCGGAQLPVCCALRCAAQDPVEQADAVFGLAALTTPRKPGSGAQSASVPACSGTSCTSA